MKPIHVLNGVNLGRLGQREPEVYGTQTYVDLVTACEATARELGVHVEVRQTDDEGQFVRWVHQSGDTAGAVVVNAGAWTHYSYAIRDALAGCRVPVVEVHLSNPGAREDFRRASVLTPVVSGVVAGFGLDSYRLALRAAARLAQPDEDPAEQGHVGRGGG